MCPLPTQCLHGIPIDPLSDVMTTLGVHFPEIVPLFM